MWVSLLSGVSSGAVSCVLLQPLDVAKTSLINPANAAQARGGGMLALFRTIVREEGALRLWKGLQPALLRITAGSAVYFASQTALLDRLRAKHSQPPEMPSAAQRTVHSAAEAEERHRRYAPPLRFPLRSLSSPSRARGAALLCCVLLSCCYRCSSRPSFHSRGDGCRGRIAVRPPHCTALCLRTRQR